MHPALANIRPLLQSVLSGSAPRQEVNRLVQCAYQIALIRLRQLMNSHRLHLQSFQISAEGAAFDCLAELFQRDGEGRFVEILDYFGDAAELEALTETEVIHRFEILVFRKLQDGIFRLYRENDPVLSKILRSIKQAVAADAAFVKHERFGQLVVSRGTDEPLYDRPEFPPEELEKELFGEGTGRTVRQLFSSLFIILNRQSAYRRMIPLITAAMIIKRVMVSGRVPVSALSTPEEEMISNDIRQIVTTAIGIAMEELRERYVVTGKLRNEDFLRYQHALSRLLIDTFVHNDGTEQSQHDYLRESYGVLSVEEYREQHRSHFEYMIRLAKRRVKEELRDYYE